MRDEGESVEPIGGQIEIDAKKNRRRTLKSLVVGGAIGGVAASLPSRWRKPVVDSVLLPAHAQTSPEDDDDDDDNRDAVGCFAAEGSLEFETTGSVTSVTYNLCLCETSPGSWDVQVLFFTSSGGAPNAHPFEGSGVPAGVETALSDLGGDCFLDQSASITITSVDPAQVVGDLSADLAGDVQASGTFDTFDQVQECSLDLTCSD